MGVGAVAVILLALLTFLRVLRNYSRLRAIPGPSAAGWSDFWRIYVRNKSHYGRRLSGLHREYGTVVRLGPRFLSVADGSIIGRLDQGVDEGSPEPHYRNAIPSNSVTVSLENIQTTHSTWECSHGLPEYEGVIDPSTKQLIKAIRRYRVLDITSSLRIFATTFINQLTTGGLLQARHDNMGRGSRWLSMFSTIEFMLIRSPVTALKRDRGRRLATCATLPVVAPTVSVEGGDAVSSNSPLPMQQPPRDGSRTRPNSNGARGGHSVAGTFVSLFYFLLRHQEFLDRLRFEIDTAFGVGSLSDIPRWRELNRLSYLDAVLKETMRLSVNFEEEIKAPVDGVIVAGYPICKNTILMWNSHVLHFDNETYGNDVHSFQPERWLLADAQQRSRMEQGLISFNRCVRDHPEAQVAWLELKKVVVLILMKFNVSI
ncbi:putative cytochrome P450 monooxygenase [Aspergillus vadensis CBS 113365]|uniref:Cytochrome P450 n=1 Tax=Aspergillus vadensis (strain CBS 113365 / IMI 142717 / IBT 24658) TaxID=1448311 RepID=A0A319BDT1_ASPVC|nr:cytochrome P450 [Aspergillus vadensis CBS 113365]PYH70817.1 cytochrome P450 [Aspergillus vadensis CBS 113365]